MRKVLRTGTHNVCGRGSEIGGNYSIFSGCVGKGTTPRKQVKLGNRYCQTQINKPQRLVHVRGRDMIQMKAFLLNYLNKETGRYG